MGKLNVYIIITGDTDFNDYSRFCQLMEKVRKDFFNYTIAFNCVLGYNVVVYTGDSHGVESMAEIFCKDQKIDFMKYETDWKGKGRSAGPLRSAEIIKDVIKQVRWKRDSENIIYLAGFRKSDGTSFGVDNCIEQFKKIMKKEQLENLSKIVVEEI